MKSRVYKTEFIKNKEKALKLFDDNFFRMWEFYLTSCETAFRW